MGKTRKQILRYSDAIHLASAIEVGAKIFFTTDKRLPLIQLLPKAEGYTRIYLIMFDTVIFDWKRTLYDPDTKKLIEGTIELLEYIKGKNIPMFLIGKGGENMQDEVNRLGVREYFSEIVFAEGEKDPNVFVKYLTKTPKNTLFIGDRVRSELEIGKRLGATTIWVKQGKFADELPENKKQEPDYTVVSLVDCLKFLQTTSLYIVFNNPKIS